LATSAKGLAALFTLVLLSVLRGEEWKSCRRRHDQRHPSAGQILDESGQLRSIGGMVLPPLYHAALSATRYVSFELVTRNRVHRHSFFEPCIVLSGSGEFEHGSAVYSLQEGDLFIADPGVYHEIRSLRTTDLGLYFLAFSLARASRPCWFGEQRGLRQEPISEFIRCHSVHLPGQSHLISLFEHAMKLSRNDGGHMQCPFYGDAAILLLNQVIAALTESARLSAEDRGDHQLTNRVAEAIEERLHQPLRIATLARDCGMSERTLRRKWKNSSGSSLTYEINHRRIVRASHLLLLPDMSIAEVGYQVGIESPAQFSRIFRAVKGLTPKDYRRKYLGRLPELSSGGPPSGTEFLNGDL
jgi:AraC-like DNA-binding protein/quercetin dioxygenase-like cupin family protein